MAAMKDFLSYENQRNKKHARLYERLLKRALAGTNEAAAHDIQVVVGHHITFEIGGNLESENEIPSADTLLFDHDLMGRVFGKHSKIIMATLCAVPCEERDGLLESYLNALEEQGEEALEGA